MEQHDTKTTRPSPSKDRGGISTGTVYVRVDKLERIRRLLSFQHHEEPTEAHVRAFIERLFTLPDQQVGDLLAREEFKGAAIEAFPKFLQEIEDLYQFALRIAKMQRNADTLRPQSAVRTKLYEEIAELHDMIMQVKNAHVVSGQELKDQIDVRLRLANVVYYAVQNLKHDLALAATSPENLTLEDATNSFRVVVQSACAQAKCSHHIGFTAAVRKFGLRSLLQQKNVPAERLLLSDIEERTSDLE